MSSHAPAAGRGVGEEAGYADLRTSYGYLIQLCGRQVPERLLVAAHIKPRSRCSEAERTAFLDIAMPACLLGCASLFEHGCMTVDEDGRILAVADQLVLPTLGLDLLGGTTAPAWNKTREPYFRWHRENRFLGSPPSVRRRGQ